MPGLRWIRRHKRSAQYEIQQMLDWCLSQSLQADGTFKTSEIDDTLGDVQMYGVWFLRDAGYFDATSASGPMGHFPMLQPCAAGSRPGWK